MISLKLYYNVNWFLLICDFMKIFLQLVLIVIFYIMLAASSLPKHKDKQITPATARELLDKGEVVSQVEKEIIDGTKLAYIQAMIKINAPREKVWRVFNDCKRAANYVPGLVSCEIIETAPDESWEIRRHIAKHSAFLPKMVSQFKSYYHYPERIDFHIVGGNLKINEGAWNLEAVDDGQATILKYHAHVASKSIIPDKIVRKAMKKAIPKTMRAIRDEVMK